MRGVVFTGHRKLELMEFDVNSASLMEAIEGGQLFHHTSRTDAGAWTQTTTKRPLIALRVSAIDNGVGTANIIGFAMMG